MEERKASANWFCSTCMSFTNHEYRGVVAKSEDRLIAEGECSVCNKITSQVFNIAKQNPIFGIGKIDVMEEDTHGKD